jgi:TM2 domain-containing membrane protein YozV
VVQDADLASNVFHIFGAHQLSLGDGLARGFALGLLVGDEVGGTELAFTELLWWLEGLGRGRASGGVGGSRRR